jgi:hypothetical protein
MPVFFILNLFLVPVSGYPNPVFFTATSMIGAFPITFDPVFSGLVWALIFGLFTSTRFTLVVIPITYYTVYNKNKKKRKTNENETIHLRYFRCFYHGLPFLGILCLSVMVSFHRICGAESILICIFRILLHGKHFRKNIQGHKVNTYLNFKEILPGQTKIFLP